jgi:hypothetical protein
LGRSAASLFLLMRVALMLALLLLVLELAVVHDTADRRLFGRGDLDQVEPRFASPLHGFIRGNDSQLFSVV